MPEHRSGANPIPISTGNSNDLRPEIAEAVVGVLLAGGLSRRMGGGDKGLLDLAGRPMLASVVERLAPQVACLVINANGAADRFAEFGLPVVADVVAEGIESFAGPLAGVLAGMRWCRAHAPDARWIVTASADAPFIPGDLVARLHAALAGRETVIAIARSDGELHPVIGLWPVALADDLERQLAAGVRKVLRWTDRHGTVAVDFPFVRIATESVDPFFNANTPDELAEARRLMTAARTA